MRARSLALLTTGLLFLSGSCLPALAQDTPIETVVVTGSRIPRAETDMPNPVTSISATDLKNSGTTNLTDYLKRIPALSGSLGDYETTGYNAYASSDGSSLSGMNLLDLRNLGYARTLVLIDGHRTVGQSTGNTAVDTDSIPITLIDRVEVSTGGSSAIYGADGVSGVVNFVMKHDLEGVDARAQFGAPQDSGGEKYLGAVSVGHNFDDDKGNVTLTYEMSRQDNLYFTDRSFTRDGKEAFLVSNPNNADGSDPTQPANIFVKNPRFIYSATTGAIDTDLDGYPDTLGSGGVFDPGIDLGYGTSIGGSGMPYADDLQGDFQPTQNRRIARAGADYQFAPWLKLSAEFNYAHTDTKSAETAPYDDAIPITADNAFLPPGVAAAIAGNGVGEALLSEDYLDMRNSELLSRDTYRFVGAATGDLPSSGFLTSIKYNVSYTYGQTDIKDTLYDNRVSDRFSAALDSVIDPATGQPTCRSNLDPAAAPPNLGNPGFINAGWGPDTPWLSDTSGYEGLLASSYPYSFTPGANSGCVAYNPFDPNYNNKAAIAWMTQNTTTMGYLSQQVVNGYVSANVDAFKDWGFADALGIVFGGEYRKEESKSTPDPATAIPGEYWEGGILPTKGSFSVGEAFAEVSLPVLADRPFAKELTLGAAGRLSHYTSTGDDQSWEVNGLYAPVSGIKFRGTDSVAVRAPNIGELYAPNQALYSFINDPCDAYNINEGTAYRAGNCQIIENGVLGPGNYVAGTTQTSTDSSTLVYSKGNSALQPETARTLTLGIVLQPDFLPDFVLTADWYRVSIADAIEAPSAQDVADECVDLSTTVGNPYCTDIVRNTGGSFPGSIKQVSTTYINVASYYTKGIDFSADYHANLDDWFGGHDGTLDFHLMGNHLDVIRTTSLPGQAPIKSENTLYGGIDGTPTPYWQFNLDTVWHLDAWTVDYNVDWYDGVLLTDRQTILSEPNYVAKKYAHLNPRDVHSIQIGYDVREGWNLYFGVDNLYYQKPSYGQNGYPVDPLGRFFYGGVKVDLDAF